MSKMYGIIDDPDCRGKIIGVGSADDFVVPVEFSSYLVLSYVDMILTVCPTTIGYDCYSTRIDIYDRFRSETVFPQPAVHKNIMRPVAIIICYIDKFRFIGHIGCYPD